MSTMMKRSCLVCQILLGIPSMYRHMSAYAVSYRLFEVNNHAHHIVFFSPFETSSADSDVYPSPEPGISCAIYVVFEGKPLDTSVVSLCGPVADGLSGCISDSICLLVPRKHFDRLLTPG